MSERQDLAQLLSEEMRPKLERAQRIWLLRFCGIALFADPECGWCARVGKTVCSARDLDGVIELALDLLRTRQDLWPGIPGDGPAEAS